MKKYKNTNKNSINNNKQTKKKYKIFTKWWI